VGGIFWLAEELLPFREGLCSVVWVCGRTASASGALALIPIEQEFIETGVKM
jgi:hypothetical protein